MAPCCFNRQCFRNFSGLQSTPTGPMSTGPAPLIAPPSDEATPVASPSHRATGRPAPQRPQLTPAVTLRVEPDQPVHQLRSGRVRLLLEPAQNLRSHPLEQVRSCPTKRRITEPFFCSIHACSFLRHARERVNSTTGDRSRSRQRHDLGPSRADARHNKAVDECA